MTTETPTAPPAETKPAKPLTTKQLQAKVDRLTEKKGKLAAELKATGDELTQAKALLKDAKAKEKEGAARNGAGH